MTVMDKIMQHIQSLPESLQTEVLDFVEYLETKKGKNEADWTAFSLSSAMRGMEGEPPLYSAQDLKESFK
jgi:hypothetical protein